MVSKILKIISLFLALGLIAIQFSRPNFENPPIMPGERIQDVLKVSSEVETILKTSCMDCHSNETRYPWYTNIAPLSWQIYDHIRMGRGDMNFSVWGTYTKRSQKKKLKEICEEVEEGNMPESQYLWLHRDAVLSDRQKTALCVWTRDAIAGLDGEKEDVR